MKVGETNENNGIEIAFPKLLPIYLTRWDRWKNTKQHPVKGLPLRYASREMEGSSQLPESAGRANDYNL